MKLKGFTLIELLVVITILGILAGIGLVTYSNVQKNSRDQKRLRDLQIIKQALELYRSNNGFYPNPWDGVVSLSDSKMTYFDTGNVPKDPLSDRYYKYVYISSASFALCAKKEGSSIPSAPAGCQGESCGTAGDCDMGITSD
ncbi:MAG: prepilin-type N-terminal cleavage/methylation domain-containing protein [Candidatus Daviesbacteria bacterium]